MQLSSTSGGGPMRSQTGRGYKAWGQDQKFKGEKSYWGEGDLEGLLLRKGKNQTGAR